MCAAARCVPPPAEWKSVSDNISRLHGGEESRLSVFPLIRAFLEQRRSVHIDTSGERW